MNEGMNTRNPGVNLSTHASTDAKIPSTKSALPLSPADNGPTYSSQPFAPPPAHHGNLPSPPLGVNGNFRESSQDAGEMDLEKLAQADDHQISDLPHSNSTTTEPYVNGSHRSSSTDDKSNKLNGGHGMSTDAFSTVSGKKEVTSTHTAPAVTIKSPPSESKHDLHDNVDIMSIDTDPVPPTLTPRLDSGEPLPKRARPHQPAPSFQNMNSNGTQIPKEQHKFCLSIVRQLKRSRDASPFLQPVDPVALNIPHYPTVITHPMDLGTVEVKLNANSYSSIDEFIADVHLIFSNCTKFNGPESPFTAMAKRLDEQFEKLVKKMPTVVAPVKSPEVKVDRGSKPKSTKPSERRTSMPVIRRNPDSNDGSGRPKREIHPPAPKELPYSVDVKPRRMRKSDRQMRFCKDVVKEMYKKSYLDFSYPFLEPVDWVTLNIPDYPKIIKKPMDLSTIRNKLETANYHNASEFEGDIRLMFQNCYRYNPPGQAVHNFGKRFEAVFDRKWKDMPEPTPEPESESESAGLESEDDDEISKLQNSLVEISAQLASLRKTKKTKKEKHKSKSGNSNKKSSSKKARRQSTASSHHRSGARGPKVVESDDEVPIVTFEQKRELSAKINDLSGQKLQHVVKIIHEGMPHLRDSANQDEIELDIDALDSNTLYRLYTYVTKNTNTSSSAGGNNGTKRKRPTASGKRSSTGGGGGGGGKRKVFDEREQEQKMAELQKSLDKYEAAEAAAAGKNPQKDSTSSESDSDSSGSESDDDSSSSD